MKSLDVTAINVEKCLKIAVQAEERAIRIYKGIKSFFGGNFEEIFSCIINDLEKAQLLAILKIKDTIEDNKS